MAEDSHGMGIPLPPDATPVHQFPGVTRLAMERVAEILAGDLPQGVKDAAAAEATAAVAAEIAAADLVLSKDERLPQALPPKPTWADVDVDSAGNVVTGLKTDGTFYVRKLDSPGTLASTDARLPQPTTTIVGWDHLELDAAGKAIYGRKTDGTIYIRQLEAANVGALPNKIAVYGDSMAGDHGGTGVSFASALGVSTGVEVHLGGIPGQTSTEAALRQGGLDVFVSVTGNSIPAAGAVAATIIQPTGIWKTGSAWTFTGSLAGIPGTLAKDAADAWTFTRTTAGAATECKPETRWIAEGMARNNWVTIFRAGKNSTNAAAIKRDALAVSRGLAGSNRRYLILPVYNSTTEPAGSANYITQMNINADHAAVHGPNYYDLRGWMIRNGLAAAGIAPTQADTDAIAQDCLPPSLMYDNTHLNVAGRQVEGARIAHVITAKGWLS